MYEKIKYDCKFFKGALPCEPNKLRDKICASCDEYIAIEKRILIIKLGAIGDVLRTTPLIVKFKMLYPASYITWITYSPEILSSYHIEEILMFNFINIYKILNINYDIAINLDKEPEACILLKDIKAREKYGFIWENGHISVANPGARHKLITGLYDNISKQNKKSYQEEIFEICGLKFNKEPYLLEYDKKLYNKWEILRKRAKEKIIIGLNTGCGKRWPTRRWPQEYWIQLIIKLQKHKFYPVLLGGKDEHKQNLYLKNQTKAFYPGYFPLKEFIAICAQCDILVSLVTMAMHIAIGLEKPLILFNNIFNKNEFELYDNGYILEPSTGCDCFYGKTCKRTRHCMYDLLPETVFEKIKLLAREKIKK